MLLLCWVLCVDEPLQGVRQFSFFLPSEILNCEENTQSIFSLRAFFSSVSAANEWKIGGESRSTARGNNVEPKDNRESSRFSSSLFGPIRMHFYHVIHLQMFAALVFVFCVSSPVPSVLHVFRLVVSISLWLSFFIVFSKRRSPSHSGEWKSEMSEEEKEEKWNQTRTERKLNGAHGARLRRRWNEDDDESRLQKERRDWSGKRAIFALINVVYRICADSSSLLLL